MVSIDRLGPELVLLLFGVVIILTDLVLRRKVVLAWLGIAGLAFSLLWTLSLLLRDRLGSGFVDTLIVDNFAIFFLLLLPAISILTILASLDYAHRFATHEGEYYSILLISTAGLMLLAGTQDLIAIYVALELTSISQYILAAFLRDERSTEAGLKYLLLGAVSSAVLLYGMAFLFGLSGQTGLRDIFASVTEATATTRPAFILALVLLAAGFGFKMAVAPFQMWVPDVYEGAPTPVTMYLSVASKAAGFAVVLRVFLEALGHPFLLNDWTTIFAGLAAVSMTVGNVIALLQTNIKRLFGYSSVAQAGYILVGVAAASAAGGDLTTLGASSVLFFIAGYAFTNLGAFIAIIAISNRLDSDRIADYAGMARRSPLLAGVLALCLVSLTGLPPTAGFLAKLYIFNAAVQADLVWLVVIAVVNTVISAYYYLRVAGYMYFQPPPDDSPVRPTWPLALGGAVTALGVLLVFFVPSPLITAAREAVNVLVQ